MRRRASGNGLRTNASRPRRSRERSLPRCRRRRRRTISTIRVIGMRRATSGSKPSSRGRALLRSRNRPHRRASRWQSRRVSQCRRLRRHGLPKRPVFTIPRRAKSTGRRPTRMCRTAPLLRSRRRKSIGIGRSEAGCFKLPSVRVSRVGQAGGFCWEAASFPCRAHPDCWTLTQCFVLFSSGHAIKDSSDLSRR